MTVHVEVRPALPPIRPAHQRSQLRPDPNTYSFGEISQQLGILDYGCAWRLGYVMALVKSAHWQFPEPLPRYNHRAGKLVDGAASVSPLSKWHKGAVDTWFERFLPPGAQLAAAAEQDTAGDALDANAGNLQAMLAGRRVRA